MVGCAVLLLALGSPFPITSVVAVSTAVQRPNDTELAAVNLLAIAVTVTWAVAFIPAATVTVLGGSTATLPAGQSPSLALSVMSWPLTSPRSALVSLTDTDFVTGAAFS